MLFHEAGLGSVSWEIRSEPSVVLFTQACASLFAQPYVSLRPSQGRARDLARLGHGVITYKKYAFVIQVAQVCSSGLFGPRPSNTATAPASQLPSPALSPR